jgi:transposase
MYNKGFRTAAVRLYEYCQSLRTVSKALGVSVSSVFRWSANGVESKVRESASYSRKVTDALLATAKAFLDHTPYMTQLEVRHKLSDAFSFACSKHLVGAIVKKLGYSFKRIRVRGVGKNQVERTKQFLRRAAELKGRVFVSVDESGFGINARRVYGYSPRGTACIVHSRRPKSRNNVSLLMAVSNDGDEQHIITADKVDGRAFATFVDSLSFPPGSVLVMDNASIHNTSDVKTPLRRKGYEALFVPPYSPEFNPIELIFGIVKHVYNRKRIETPWSDEDERHDIIDASIYSAINGHTIMRCFSHVSAFGVDYMM